MSEPVSEPRLERIEGGWAHFGDGCVVPLPTDTKVAYSENTRTGPNISGAAYRLAYRECVGCAPVGCGLGHFTMVMARFQRRAALMWSATPAPTRWLGTEEVPPRSPTGAYVEAVAADVAESMKKYASQVYSRLLKVPLDSPRVAVLTDEFAKRWEECVPAPEGEDPPADEPVVRKIQFKQPFRSGYDPTTNSASATGTI